MSEREGLDRKADDIVRRYEEDRLMLEKHSEDLEVIEEVFDKLTLEGIFKLMRTKVIDRVDGVVKAGKEARIYWAEDPKGEELALKIYYTSTAEFRRGMLKYIEGDPRFRRVRRDSRSIIYAWTQKEFKNLKLAEGAGVNAPRTIAFHKNILVMKFIGRDGVPAPLLRETVIEDPEAFYTKLIKDIRLLYVKAGLIHGDLSEYNIMVWQNQPVIFDVSQAVLKAHPMSDEFLRRDINNVNSYFERLGVDVMEAEEMEQWIKSGAENIS